MTHLADYAAHATVRAVVFRAVYHMPLIIVGVLVIAACLFIARSRP